VDLHSLSAILPLLLVASPYLFFSHIVLLSLLLHILAPICRAVAAYPGAFEEELARRGHFRCLRHNRKCRCNAITCRKKQIYGYNKEGW